MIGLSNEGMDRERVRIVFKRIKNATMCLYGTTQRGFVVSAPTQELAIKVLREDLKALGLRIGEPCPIWGEIFE